MLDHKIELYFFMLPGKRCVYFLHHVAKTKVSFLVRFVALLCFFVRLEFLMKKECLDKNEWETFLQNFWHKLRKLICKLHGKCNAYLAKYSKNEPEVDLRWKQNKTVFLTLFETYFTFILYSMKFNISKVLLHSSSLEKLTIQFSSSWKSEEKRTYVPVWIWTARNYCKNA